MYFSHLSHTNNPANALQRQAREVLESLSNQLIGDAVVFITNLKAVIEKLNAANPRCTPLRLSTSSFTAATTNIYLGEHFTVSFSLYLVKNSGPGAGAVFEIPNPRPQVPHFTEEKAFAAAA